MRRLSLLFSFLLSFLLSGSVAFGEETYHKRADWIREHGKQAGRPSAACYDCHQASHCTDCHGRHQELLPEVKNPEAVEKGYVHRADFRSRHAGEARTDPARCARCHTPQSCQACHTREGINTGAANYPHPAGWMVQGSSQFHGRVARQDIVLCASCHERGAATNCVVCHAPGGTGGSPHPPGWQTSLSQNSPACQACH